MHTVHHDCKPRLSWSSLQGLESGNVCRPGMQGSPLEHALHNGSQPLVWALHIALLPLLNVQVYASCCSKGTELLGLEVTVQRAKRQP